MNRDEFQRTVKSMQDAGVALTMANLMVRTELPRAQIEEWLDDVQRDVKIERPAPKSATRESDRPAVGLAQRAKALRGEIVADVVKSQLGLGSARTQDRPKRDVKIGGGLGLVLPPAGLLYSAPLPTAAAGGVLYLALAWLALHLPMIGIPYILIPLHLAGAVASAGYAWRFNHRGQRTNLLPGGSTKRDDE